MQTRSSRMTCINAMPAIAGLVEMRGGWLEGGHNLDIGCGCYRQLDSYLKDRGVISVGYDLYRPEHTDRDWDHRRYHTVTCSNVLNVIDCDIALSCCIARAYASLHAGGTYYVTVHEANRSGIGRETKVDCWQRNERTEAYVARIAQMFGTSHVARYGKLIVARKEGNASA